MSATPPPDAVTVTIDGIEVEVPKGTLVIRAAEQLGIQIPRFCDHPLLAPAGACRQCLVEVALPGPDGSLRPMPKPQASCTLEASGGMVVSTQETSAVAEKAQRGVMELLLINHPLDCPVCDKGGECPLQNQAMSNGASTSRFVDVKRTFPKPIKISTEVLLDRDRCILCQRCTRFSKEIAGDPFIDLQMRGVRQQIGVFDEAVLGYDVSALPEEDVVGPDGEPGSAAGLLAGPQGEASLDTSGRRFASYFSGNTIQICPVGALTSATYRFRSRPFDLVSSPSVAEHDACGSAIRIDHRRGVVLRRLSGEDPEVNEEWITDKDRFAFAWQSAPDRLTAPLVRDPDTGELVQTSWSEALAAAARGLRDAADGAGVGLLPGGRLTLEDAYAWSKFARVAVGTNDVDFRARAHSGEEAAFLGARVAGTGLGVTYADVEQAPVVLLVGLEPEDEAGALFLRLRKGVLAGRVTVVTIAPFASAGSAKLRAEVMSAAPGTEAAVLDSIAPRGRRTPAADRLAALAADLAEPGALVLLGERLASSPGALSAADRLVERTGARFAWVPRRAGDRGALDAGAMPGLLPGGRSAGDGAARAEVASVWGVPDLPDSHGRDVAGILAAAADGRLGALVVGGVDVEDLPDPQSAERALDRVGFVVQLEVRSSSVTPFADVVLPVAPPVEKAGTFLTWEGRQRPFGQALTSRALSDARVLDALADQLDSPIGVRSLDAVHSELARLPRPAGARQAGLETTVPAPAAVGQGEAVLATWKLNLDSGRGQDGEPHLAGTARRAVARLSPQTAEAVGAVEGEPVTVTGPAGWITLPAAVTSMPDGVVWLPQHSPGSRVNRGLGVGAGAVVALSVPGQPITAPDQPEVTP